jgi:hypothetical protein
MAKITERNINEAQIRGLLRSLGVQESAIDNAFSGAASHPQSAPTLLGRVMASLRTGSAQHTQRVVGRLQGLIPELNSDKPVPASSGFLSAVLGTDQMLGAGGVPTPGDQPTVSAQLSGMIGALERRGVSSDQVKKALAQARAEGAKTGTLTQPGDVDPQLFATALGSLGENVGVVQAAQNYGFATPKAGTPASTTPPAAPQPGGPTAAVQQAHAGTTPAPAPAADPFAGKSKAEIKAIQKQLGVKQDGIAGPLTRAAYDRAHGTSTATAPGVPPPSGVSGGGTGGGGGGTAVAPPAAPATPDTKNMSDDQILAYVRQNYGSDAAYLDANPGLRSIFFDAVRNHPGDTAYLENQVRQTDWFKNTSESQRLYDAKKRLDPASAQADVTAMAQQLGTFAKAQGVVLDPTKLNDIAEQAVRGSWSSSQAQQAILHEFNYRQGGAFGQAAKTESDVHQLAGEYLVPISDQAKGEWINRITRGDDTIDGFRSYLTEQAKSLFPGLSAALDAGISTKQYADPYVQLASQELEVPHDSIDLMNPRYMRALNQVDPKSGERTSMSLSDWTTYLRSLPEWQKTSGAKSLASDMVTQLGKTFGQVA